MRSCSFEEAFATELTELDSTELNPYSNQQVKAAGYVTSAGLPDSVAAIDYKYSRPRVRAKAKYNDLFPSVTAKYTFFPNLLGDLGWGKTIKRPTWATSAAHGRSTTTPSRSPRPTQTCCPNGAEKIAASLSYFFGKASINNVQVVASHTKTKNQTLAKTITADQYGNTDPAPINYEFISFTNATSPVTWNSMEYSYTQYLTFLPRFFQGTSINASYTRTYVTAQSGVFISGVIPNSVKAPGLALWPGRPELQRDLAGRLRSVPEQYQPLSEGQHQV